ncbi:type VI secretion system baseplate subunit TssG [Utexia brackfieldae]|uniref:type VI secretion system baseplate subunit TssG n=1 Tax=Utexia brackfieldae TaxID=3074108 RepID=UPI00370D4413
MAVDQSLIPADAERYQFFQLVELLYKAQGIDVDTLLDYSPDQDPIRFISDSTLAFVTRDITSVTIVNDQLQIKTPFLSLTGAHSPLPSYYLDDMAWEELAEDPRMITLFNLFHHRLASYLYKIWRKYRYFICFQPAGRDQFSAKMYALVGLESRMMRDALLIDRNKMLTYAGILANSGRSPQLIATLISHCFSLSQVEIRSWQFRWVNIPDPQRNRIGVQNCVLGKNFIAGSRMPDNNGKFKLTISDLSFAQMKQFLPTGSLYAALVNFVSFILRDQLAWDLCLILANNQIKDLKLSANTESYLGWTCFLGKSSIAPFALITVQE